MRQKQAGRPNHTNHGLSPEKGSGTEAEVQASGREIACGLFTSGLDGVSWMDHLFVILQQRVTQIQAALPASWTDFYVGVDESHSPSKKK